MADRHKKNPRRNGATGKPSPHKDRSAHDKARGKKLPTLAELSREMPTGEELQKYPEMLSNEESDRSAAIMAAALLEQALYVCITSRIPDAGQVVRNAWFDAPNAPFATFSDKIKLGRALAIYGERMEALLSSLKDIRNVFAHRSTPIDFTHPTLVAKVKALESAPMIGKRPVKTRYCALCVKAAALLVEDALKHGGKELVISFP